MSGLRIFEHKRFGKIRTVEIDGEPWLAGKDVAEALGYKDTKSALLDHVDEEDRRILKSGDLPPLENHIPKDVFPVNFTAADIPNRGLTVINESGLYALVLSSKLPGAKEFRRWATSEVLPSVRKHGAYMTPDTIDKMIASPEFGIKLLTALKEERAKRSALEVTVETQRQTIADFAPIQQYVDTILSSPRTMTTTQIAADYDLTANKLNKILHEEGVQRKVGGQWVLYKHHMGNGYTKSETISITRSDGTPDTVMHTKWSQKGRLMIHNILERRGIKAAMDKEAEANAEESGSGEDTKQ